MRLVMGIILVILLLFFLPNRSEGVSTSISELETRVLQLESQVEQLEMALAVNTSWDCSLESVVRIITGNTPYQNLQECISTRMQLYGAPSNAGV